MIGRDARIRLCLTMVGICGKHIHIILQMQSTGHIDATLNRPTGFVTWCKPFYQNKYFLFIIAQSCYCCLPLYQGVWCLHLTPHIDLLTSFFNTVVGFHTEQLILSITVFGVDTEHLLLIYLTVSLSPWSWSTLNIYY